MEYITARAHPTPKTKPRNTPIIADHIVVIADLSLPGGSTIWVIGWV